jgi:hypothetical protein
MLAFTARPSTRSRDCVVVCQRSGPPGIPLRQQGGFERLFPGMNRAVKSFWCFLLVGLFAVYVSFTVKSCNMYISEKRQKGEFLPLDVLARRLEIKVLKGEPIPRSWEGLGEMIDTELGDFEILQKRIMSLRETYWLLEEPIPLNRRYYTNFIIIIGKRPTGFGAGEGRWALVITSNLVSRELIREGHVTEELGKAKRAR